MIVSGYDRLLSGIATNYSRNNTRLVSPIIIERLQLLSFPKFPASGIRAARNGQSFAKYAASAFTDEVNCIVDNEK